MPLPIIAAYGLRAGGAMLLKKVINSKLGKEVKEKLKNAIIKKFGKKKTPVLGKTIQTPGILTRKRLGKTLIKKFAKSSEGGGIQSPGVLRATTVKKLKKLREAIKKDRRKTKAPDKKPQSDKDILLRINRDRLKGEGVVIPKSLKFVPSRGGRVKKSKKKSRPLKRTTADKAFDTVAGVGLAAASINAAVEERRKPKKDRATWMTSPLKRFSDKSLRILLSKHETSVMKKNRKAKEEKAKKIKKEREK